MQIPNCEHQRTNGSFYIITCRQIGEAILETTLNFQATRFAQRNIAAQSKISGVGILVVKRILNVNIKITFVAPFQINTAFNDPIGICESAVCCSG